MEFKEQLDGLTVSYQRIAESFGRIASKVEEHSKIIFGERGEDNRIIPGLLQRAQDMEECLRNTRWWKRQWWSVVRDLGIGMVSSVILIKYFGLGG